MSQGTGKAVKAIKNMSFTLGAMAELTTSRSIFFDGCGLALATGTGSASENWAFFPDGASLADAKRVCAFFKDLGLPFIWPLFPDAAYGGILESAGMPVRGELLAMARTGYVNISPAFAKNLTFETNESDEKNKISDAWAEAAWVAFNSPPGAPDSFVKLARGLCARDDIILLLARRGRVSVGTAMLALNGESAGIYYFATMPEERRTGVGKAILHEASRLAFERRCTLMTLQATPEGVPFYASQGFTPLFRLPIYSFSEDVF